MSVTVNVVGQTAVSISVASQSAASVSVAASTGASVVASGGIGPAGFITVPGTATAAFGTFQLQAGDGITVSTANGQFLISSYPSTTVASLAPVQSVAGRTGAIVLQASDVTAGTFAIGRIPTIGYTALSGVPTAFSSASHTHDAAAISSGTLSIARIPTISYTALSNTPATFSPASHTHSTSDVVAFTAAASAAAPVQSVQSRTGAVVLTRADLTAAAQVHTHSTSDVVGLTAAFSQIGHTHSTTDVVAFTASASAAAPVQNVAGRTGAISLAVADISGLASVASSGSYTSLSNVPASFAPSSHTHSTGDITGYQGLPAQAGKAGPLVTDGTNATWTSRYSIVSPVLVQGAGMTLTRDTAAGSITVAFAGGTSGVSVSSATPQPLGTASAGSSSDAARADHVHVMPSAADVGAAAASHSHPYVQVLNGLTGTLSISGGAGVTVSTASSSITIAAAGSYTLPPASSSVLGGIKVGANLTITDGVLAATGGGGSANIVEATTAAGFPATGSSGTLYHATDSSRIYFWDASGVYVEAGTSGGGGSGGDGTDAALRALFAPPAPTSVTATISGSNASVSWTAPTVLSQTPITDYTVQYSTNSGSTWTTFTRSASTATSATVTGQGSGGYQFRVSATNGAGTGAYSSVATLASSKLTVARGSGGASTVTGLGTAASPFTRAARVANNNADGLMAAGNGINSGTYTFTATASGTAYVTCTFYDDGGNGAVGFIRKNGAQQGAYIADGATVTARAITVASGDVITFNSDYYISSFSNVSVWVV